MTDLTQIFPGGFRAETSSPAPADPLAAFRAALERADLRPREVVADGQLHRCADGPDDKGKAGWYVLYLDECPVGVFGSWKRELHETWSARALVSDADRALHASRVAEARARSAALQEQQHREAADKAGETLARCAPATAAHPYLARKQVGAHGIFEDGKGLLLVPRRDVDGELWSYQTIAANGEKRYQAHGRAKGTFHLFGGTPTTRLYVAEGYATAASVHEATGCPVAVAFDAHNLEPVALALREGYPAVQIVIAADDDRGKPHNTGLAAAARAARAVNGRIAAPGFPPGAGGKDWNDLHSAVGLDEVRRQLGAVAPGLELVSLASLVASARPPAWLIRGIEERDSLVVTFGEPGAAKSFFEIDKALSVAHGMDWHGHKVDEPGVVVYVAGEGHGGLSRRVLAWLLARGVSGREAPFYVTPHRVSMMAAEEAQRLREALSAVAQKHGRIDKIVIDTLARNMGGDENSTADMNAFVEALDTYLRIPFKACVTVVHHTGWQAVDRMRGSRALEGACDTACCVARDAGGVVTVEAKRMKDGELFEPKYFRLSTVELPLQDAEGQPLTSAVLEPSESPDEAFDNLRPQVRRAYEWLRGKQLEMGMTLKAQGRDPATARLEWRGWKDGSRQAGIWEGAHGQFSKISRDLEAAGLVRRDGLFVFLVEPDTTDE